jgi:hypothetical protein
MIAEAGVGRGGHRQTGVPLGQRTHLLDHLARPGPRARPLGHVPGQLAERLGLLPRGPQALDREGELRLDLHFLLLGRAGAPQEDQQQREGPEQEQAHLHEVPPGEGTVQDAEGEPHEDPEGKGRDRGQEGKRRVPVREVGEDQEVGHEEDHEERYDEADRPDGHECHLPGHPAEERQHLVGHAVGHRRRRHGRREVRPPDAALVGPEVEPVEEVRQGLEGRRADQRGEDGAEGSLVPVAQLDRAVRPGRETPPVTRDPEEQGHEREEEHPAQGQGQDDRGHVEARCPAAG